MALNREGKSVEERKRELEDEAEEYASRGIVSPGAITAARWFSRVLWLAMSALVVILLFRLQDHVPRENLEKLQKQHEELQKESKKTGADLEEMKLRIIAEASRFGLIGGETIGDLEVTALLDKVLTEGRKARSREEADALVLADLAQWRAGKEKEAGARPVEGWFEDFRKAPVEKRLAAAALAARMTEGMDKASQDFFAGIAIARDASLAERVVAIRWLGEKGRKDNADLARVLEGLQSDTRTLIVAEAKKAQEALK